MKLILILMSALLLSSCANDTDVDETGTEMPKGIDFNMPEGLKDCKVFLVHARTPGFSSIIVTRCPHSETSTRYGKNGLSIVADDTEEVDDKP